MYSTDNKTNLWRVTSRNQLLTLGNFGAVKGWEQWLLQGQK